MRVRDFVVGVFAAQLFTFAPTSYAQTGSLWRGLVDANVPFDFYAERFNNEGIVGTFYFGSPRFGYDGANRLCDEATLTARPAGDGYEYTVTGECRGKGALRFADQSREKLVGEGTLYDAASASGRKRRHFFMTRE